MVPCSDVSKSQLQLTQCLQRLLGELHVVDVAQRAFFALATGGALLPGLVAGRERFVQVGAEDALATTEQQAGEQEERADTHGIPCR